MIESEHNDEGPVLVVDNVMHTWVHRGESRDALRGVSADCHSGVACFVCGPSGAGKSTLGMALAGLISPKVGRVLLDGNDVVLQRKRIAYVFQFPEAIFFHDTVHRELEEICAGRFDETEIESDFARLGISFAAIRDQHPFTLSEGYARLTAVAMQMARRPDVLILDEPTIGLDWKRQERLIHALMNWVSPERILVVITHDLQFLEQAGGNVWLMDAGQLEWSGTTQELLSDQALLKKFALRA